MNTNYFVFTQLSKGGDDHAANEVEHANRDYKIISHVEDPAVSNRGCEHISDASTVAQPVAQSHFVAAPQCFAELFVLRVHVVSEIGELQLQQGQQQTPQQ